MDGSAKRRLAVGKELGDHWGPTSSGSKGLRRLRDGLEATRLLRGRAGLKRRLPDFQSPVFLLECVNISARPRMIQLPRGSRAPVLVQPGLTQLCVWARIFL